MPLPDSRSQTGPIHGAHRVQALESIRALAAFQVLLLHLFSAFAPALVFYSPGNAGIAEWINNSALSYFYDGSSAVYVFFTLSGCVLTAPFVRDGNRPGRVITARWLRLAIPAVAACLFALAMLAVWPRAHVEAGLATGSHWLVTSWLPTAGFIAFLRDAVASALFTGYDQNGAVVALGLRPDWLPPIAGAYVAPLWTISIEFFGSALVLALAICWRHFRRAWVPLAIVAALVLVRTPYLCFVIGHFVGLAALTGKSNRLPGIACLFGIAFGIYLCTKADHAVVVQVGDVCRFEIAWWPTCQNPPLFQKQLGALLVFLSVVAWPGATRILSSPRLALFGRLSFPVYLVHWPIVFGPCAFVYLLVRPVAGGPAASTVAIILGLGATFVAALAFVRVDTGAKHLSRVVRNDNDEAAAVG